MNLLKSPDTADRSQKAKAEMLLNKSGGIGDYGFEPTEDIIVILRRNIDAEKQTFINNGEADTVFSA